MKILKDFPVWKTKKFGLRCVAAQINYCAVKLQKSAHAVFYLRVAHFALSHEETDTVPFRVLT